MKINSNSIILLVLIIFVASNAILYRYLNDGYFIDKKPDTKTKNVENVIFSLIGAHELVLAERNAEILAEAQHLRDMKASITDLDELKKIEDQLRALEEKSKAVLERIKSSENEREVAVQQSQNDKVQLSDLLETNSRMGVALDNINTEFDNYVTTLKETLISKSFSESATDEINKAFINNRGLNYINDLVGNIQENKSLLTNDFMAQIKERSDSYYDGLKLIAKEVDDNNFIGYFDDKELIKTDESISNLKKSIDQFKLSEEQKHNRDINKRLSDLSRIEMANNQETINTINLENDKLIEQLKSDALLDKELSLQKLEEKLRSELVEREQIVEINPPTPDKPIYTNWIHIPGLWTSTSTSISYDGKKVDSIAWSRNSIEDNQSISFDGKFDSNGECLLILYGNGRFKSWDTGLIISISDLGSKRVMISINSNGIDENSNLLFSNNISIDGSINGSYYLQIIDSKLSIYLNGAELIKDFLINVDLNGRIGFGNREINSHNFTISNIKLFKIQ